MYWIEKSREDRAKDVKSAFADLVQQSPDRIWLSTMQDGPNAQHITLMLPVVAEDVLYEFRIITAQLRAAQIAAYELGQKPGQRIAIIPALLDRMNLIGQESFEINNNHETGVLVDVVLDTDGLTHEVIEALLLSFIANEYVPPRLRPINPMVLVERLVDARDQKLTQHYPLF